MDARVITIGDKLYLKPHRAAAYGMAPIPPARCIVIEVADKRAPNGYLTPWIYDHNGYAYRPSDFLRRA